MKKAESTKEKSNIFNVVIIGRPNVGKSSLFNRICGYRKAVVLNEPRTTRDIIEEPIDYQGKAFNLIDTAGHFKGKGDEIEQQSMVKITEALNRANLVVFVTDATTPVTEEDEIVANIVRKTGKPTLLVANKVDQPNRTMYANDYKKFGFKDIFFVSTIHNLGIAELMIAITKDIAATSDQRPVTSGTPVKLAIIGRPNVGKSSLLNALSKKERAIVSDVPGTTRDVLTEKIKTTTCDLTVSDTAGTRRPGKIGKAFKKGEPIERYAHLRTEKEIDKADIVLLVLDATEKRATTQDLHIAGIAKEKGKGIILVINKWDLVDGITQEKFLYRLRARFSFMIWVPAIFVSAKTGLNVENIATVVDQVAENQRRQIQTSVLNRIVEDFSLQNLPKGAKGLKPKVYFASQTGVIPPTFKISAKHSELIHFSWPRALSNELRRQYDFAGTPIRIVFSEKNK